MIIVSKLTFFSLSEVFELLWISFHEKKFSGLPMGSGWPQEQLVVVGSSGDPTTMLRYSRKSWLINTTGWLCVPGCRCIDLSMYFI